jgi:hypothetical protein
MREIWHERDGQRLFRETLESGAFRYVVVDYDTGLGGALPIDPNCPEVTVWADGSVINIAVETRQMQPFLITPGLAGFLVDKLGFRVRFATPGYVVRTQADGIAHLVKTEARQGRV